MSYQIKNKVGMFRYILFLVMLTLPFAAAHAGNGNGNGPSNRVNKGNHLSAELQALADASTDGYVDVIIQYTSASQSSDDADVIGQGGAKSKQLGLINGNLYHVPVKALKHLVKNPHVLYVTPDRATRMSADTAYVAQTVGANIAQSYGYDGTGVGVAIIDSGVGAHRDLQNKNNNGARVVYSESFVTGQSAADNYGHGTHVAGIIAGNGSASNGTYKGIAPNVNIINLRALDSNGGGSDSTVIAAINRAIQLKSQYNIRVINLSLGRPVFESYTLDPLCQAVEQAWKAGIFVAVAAGNNGRDNTYGTNGYATIDAPGNDPFVMTVGATNTEGTPSRSDDIMTSFSSKGPAVIDHIVKPDVVAPGNNVTSLGVPNSTLANLLPGDVVGTLTNTVTTVTGLLGSFTSTVNLPTGYFTLSGTSMATPVVAGTAALMIQKDPTLTPDQIKARIMKSATKLGKTYGHSQDRKGNNYINQYDVFTVGAGYLDTWGALSSTDKGNGYALSPAAFVNGNGQIVFTGQGISNGQSVIWGDSVIWGGDALTANSVIWSDSVIWGGDVIDASSVIWGNSVIWGDTSGSDSASSVIWGNSVIWGSDQSMQGLSAGDEDVDPTVTLDANGNPINQ